MITSIFIVLGSVLFNVLGTLLPDSSSIPAGIAGALTYVVSSINAYSFIIPVDSLFDAMIIVVLYQSSMWLFRGVIWVWNKVPIIGK